MKRGLSITGVLALWTVLTLCISSTGVLYRGTQIGYGDLLVQGNFNPSGNVTSGGTISGDSLIGTLGIHVYQCGIFDGKIAVKDSARFNSGFYAGGAQVTRVLSGSASLDFDLTALTEQDKQFTLNGVNLGDTVFLGVPNGSVTASVAYSAWVLSSNTINVRAKTRVAGENPASGTFKVVVFQ